MLNMRISGLLSRFSFNSRLIQQLIASSAVVTVGNIVHRGANFVLFAVLANISSTGAAASVQLIAMLAAYAPLLNFRISTYFAFLRFNKGRPEDESLVLTLMLILALLLAVPAGLYAAWAASSGATSEFSATLTILAVLGALSVALQEFAVSAFTGAGKFVWAMATQVSLAVLLLASAAAALALPQHADLIVMSVFAFAGVTTSAIFAAWYSSSFRAPKWDWSAVRQCLSFSAPLVVSGIFLAPLLVSLLPFMSQLSAEDRTAFFVAQNWQGLVMALPGILSTASLSMFFSSGAQERRQLGRVMLVLNVLFVICVAAAVYTLSPFIDALYGDESGLISSTVTILILAAIPLSIFQVANNHLMSINRTNDILSSNVAFAIVMVAALVLDYLGVMNLWVFSVIVVMSYAARCVAAYGLIWRHEKRLPA